MKRGASRMREQGYKQVHLWFSPKEWERIHTAARAERKPVATWIRNNANELAEMVVNNELAESAKRKARAAIDRMDGVAE